MTIGELAELVKSDPHLPLRWGSDQFAVSSFRPFRRPRHCVIYRSSSDDRPVMALDVINWASNPSHAHYLRFELADKYGRALKVKFMWGNFALSSRRMWGVVDDVSEAVPSSPSAFEFVGPRIKARKTPAPPVPQYRVAKPAIPQWEEI